jgi:short-subunit dehydrogenase/acyl carrier protein
MSGDKNPLHHDVEFSAKSQFGAPIVPLHMTLSPLSAIAGMHFPGKPSLYLGHEVRSILPVYFGEDVTYSARIVAINAVKRVLTVRVLAISRSEVCLDCTMRVQCLSEEWQSEDAAAYHHADHARTALITGATGEIGTAFAIALAAQGWNLILQDRGPGAKRNKLQASLAAMSSKIDVRFEAADLGSVKDVENLCGRLAKGKMPKLLLHTASPPVESAMHNLVQVNYAALERIARAMVPSLLENQDGAIVGISTIATERAIAGWEAYSGAKSMLGNYIAGVNKRYRQFGIRGCTILAGLVATAYSNKYRGDQLALAPEELVSQVLAALAEQEPPDAIIVEATGTSRGRIGFHTELPSSPQMLGANWSVSAANKQETVTTNQSSYDRISQIVRRTLRLPENFSLAGAGVGITPGWDSLKQIELMLALERDLKLKFAAREIEKALTFDVLADLCAKKLVS